jgi:hypothetical protein
VTLGPGGEPLLRAQELRSAEALLHRLHRVYGTPLPAPERVQAYRWRDADGAWQLSDHPPPAGVDYELIEVDPDANLMPAPEAR